MSLHEGIAAIINGLRERDLRIAFAESCTGGRLAADLTAVSGSSDVVVGSAVCYQLAAKHKILGLIDVTEETVVSMRTAKGMATSAQRIFDADIGVGTTGFLDGDHPHAFWAMRGPHLNDPIKNQHIEGWRIDFPASSSREHNRETLIRAVMEGLTIWTTEHKDG